MPEIIIGVDHPDRIFFATIDDRKDILEIIQRFQKYDNNITTNFSDVIYISKNEDYNLEDIYKYYFKHRKKIYILKNDIWNICSCDTDYIMVPFAKFNGEFFQR